jgi:multidrug efflux system outer membrane protein
MKRCVAILVQVSALIALVSLFGSCSLFEPAVRQPDHTQLPERYSLYADTPLDPFPWWQTFGVPEINALVTAALGENFSLQQAWARLRQANAMAVKSGAARFPELNVTGSGALTHQKITTGGSTGSETTLNTQTYSAGLAGSYEVDLWGRLRSDQQAALLEAAAVQEDIYSAEMTLCMQVVEHWLNIIYRRMQKRLLEAQLVSNQTYLELVELRFRKAMVSALDVFQQRQVLEQVKAQIPLVEAEEQVLRHELALLIGKPPLHILDIESDTLPDVPKIPTVGLPADLLVNRPDVRAAGQRLFAADWQVAAARANRLPSISLTATARYGAAEMDVLFDNWIFNLAGNLVGPLFDGRRRRAEVARTRAVVDEKVAAYRETVLTAVTEVENALVREEKQMAHIRALERQYDAAQHALVEARERYRNGLSDYLPILTQLLTVQSLERDLLQKRTQRLVYRLSLYRALGGNWPRELVSR